MNEKVIPRYSRNDKKWKFRYQHTQKPTSDEAVSGVWMLYSRDLSESSRSALGICEVASHFLPMSVSAQE